MGTSSTPRLGLSKPDETELMTQVVRDWNSPMDILDKHAGMFPCTSGTRPVNPYLGQLIRETDTSKCLIWNGSSWVVYITKDVGWHCTGLTDLTPPNNTPYILNSWSTTDLYNCSMQTNGIQLNTPGLYFASVNVRWQQRAHNAMAFDRTLFLELLTSGGAAIAVNNNGSNANGTIATSDFTYKSAGGMFACTAAGQFIRPMVFQLSGGAFNLVATDSWFSGVLIAPLETY